jgi:hypothetical protein
VCHYIKKEKGRACTTPSLTHTPEMIQVTPVAIEKANLKNHILFCIIYNVMLKRKKEKRTHETTFGP